jgi:hypothetical protein
MNGENKKRHLINNDDEPLSDANDFDVYIQDRNKEAEEMEFFQFVYNHKRQEWCNEHNREYVAFFRNPECESWDHTLCQNYSVQFGGTEDEAKKKITLEPQFDPLKCTVFCKAVVRTQLEYSFLDRLDHIEFNERLAELRGLKPLSERNKRNEFDINVSFKNLNPTDANLIYDFLSRYLIPRAPLVTVSRSK